MRVCLCLCLTVYLGVALLDKEVFKLLIVLVFYRRRVQIEMFREADYHTQKSVTQHDY